VGGGGSCLSRLFVQTLQVKMLHSLGSGNSARHLVDFKQYLLDGDHINLTLLLLDQINLSSDLGLLSFKLGQPGLVVILLLLSNFNLDLLLDFNLNLLSLSLGSLLSFDLHLKCKLNCFLLLLLNDN